MCVTIRLCDSFVMYTFISHHDHCSVLPLWSFPLCKTVINVLLFAWKLFPYTDLSVFT